MPGFFQSIQGFRLADQIGGKGGAVRVVAVEIILVGIIRQLKVCQGQTCQIFFHIESGTLCVKAA